METWGKAARKPKGKKEKRKLLAKFVELAVLEIFGSHTYEFGGRVYRQWDGGPMGLALSGAIAELPWLCGTRNWGNYARKTESK